MYTEEDSDRYIAQCFVNGLYASDGEINLEKNDNLISNDYAVKLCLIIRLERRKKIKLKKKNTNLDDLETLLDFDFDEAPQTETDLPPLVCKMGKGSRNKKKVMENIMYFNNGTGPSSSFGTPLTQGEAEKRALAHNIGMRYEILEEVRPVIETLAHSDKYKKLLDEIWADKVRLDGMVKPEEERVMVKVKGQMLKEKKDPGAFLFPIRLEGQIDENALADTGSDTNTMPYRIYEQLVGFTTLSAKFLILEILVDRDAPIVTSGAYDHEARSSHAKRSRNVETVEEALLPDVHHEFLEAFNIREPIYPELCHEFYATYKFDEVDDIQRVAAQRVPRFQRASMQEIYERMGSMEIKQEAIERMEYRQSYHWDSTVVLVSSLGISSVFLLGVIAS
ncbi:hypothetical protein Tco_0704498 [Tanacetum coccineum]|uniref:Uncharacterized protein n=1 Tax=Tanacetum coccineum TaxID=301880 RepID=A0ABQ4Y2P0_9ASTR